MLVFSQYIIEIRLENYFWTFFFIILVKYTREGNARAYETPSDVDGSNRIYRIGL